MRNTTLFIATIAALTMGSDPIRAQRAAPSTLEDTAACMQHARRDTDLLPRQLERLCIATPSPTAPVACFVEASRSLLLTDVQSVELCRCTATMQPVACFRELREASLLTEPDMIALCSPSIVRNLRADCTPVP